MSKKTSPTSQKNDPFEKIKYMWKSPTEFKKSAIFDLLFLSFNFFDGGTPYWWELYTFPLCILPFRLFLYISQTGRFTGCVDRLRGQSFRMCLARCLLPCVVSSNFWEQWGHLMRFGGGRSIWIKILCLSINITFSLIIKNTVWYLKPRGISVPCIIYCKIWYIPLCLFITMKKNAFAFMMANRRPVVDWKPFKCPKCKEPFATHEGSSVFMWTK